MIRSASTRAFTRTRLVISLTLFFGSACIDGEPVAEERACEANPDCFQGDPCRLDLCEAGRCVVRPLPENTPGGGDHDGDEICDAGDPDTDGDMVLDGVDVCPRSPAGSVTDSDGDGCFDGEDPDDDNDRVLDEDDACPVSTTPDFVSNPRNDVNGDGCEDDVDDGDIDGDGVSNGSDRCPQGEQEWTSSPATDRDGDGCRDETEDQDDDDDGLADNADDCDASGPDWFSEPNTDWDRDGCRDRDEDLDDDNDGVPDVVDRLCPQSPVGATGFRDADEDGCEDVLEDDDVDDDGVPDPIDDCRDSPLDDRGSPDRDGDGCYDNQDLDPDGDGVPTGRDACEGIDSEVGWESSPLTDLDRDGCRDAGEDPDDDNDGVRDQRDACPEDPAVDDPDEDGCDNGIDEDDDGDGVVDLFDGCPLDVDRADAADWDGDGCADAVDDDDDDDGVPDALDDCDDGEPGWTALDALDHDGDGCIDGREDTDDDNDNRPDADDDCPVGDTGWDSTSLELDADGDGCRDATEDLDDDDDGVPDDADCAPTDPLRSPGNPEVCDALDNDCDDEIDEGARQLYYIDADGDGFGDPAGRVRRCDGGEGFSLDGTDCDDADAARNPRDGCDVALPDRDGVWAGPIVFSTSIAGDRGSCRGTIQVRIEAENEVPIRGQFQCRFEGLLALLGAQEGTLSGALAPDHVTAQGVVRGALEGGFVAVFAGEQIHGFVSGDPTAFETEEPVETAFTVERQ